MFFSLLLSGCDKDILFNPIEPGDSISGKVTFIGDELQTGGDYYILVYDSWAQGIPYYATIQPQQSGYSYKSDFNITGLHNQSRYYVCLAFIKNNHDKIYILGVWDCGTNMSCISNPPTVNVPATGVNFNSFLLINSALLQIPYWSITD